MRRKGFCTPVSGRAGEAVSTSLHHTVELNHIVIVLGRGDQTERMRPVCVCVFGHTAQILLRKPGGGGASRARTTGTCKTKQPSPHLQTWYSAATANTKACKQHKSISNYFQTLAILRTGFFWAHILPYSGNCHHSAELRRY